jgi:hypothetical protein
MEKHPLPSALYETVKAAVPELEEKIIRPALWTEN